MKRLTLLFGFLIAPLITVLAQQNLFEKGNAAYQNQQYDSAISTYTQVLEQNEMHSVALYYNLGNSYFKKGDLGQSILHYERALQLSPHDEETKQNLAIAQQKTVDRFDELPQTLVQNVYLGVLKLLLPSTWAVISLCFLGAFVLGTAGYLFSSYGRAGFISAFIGLALGLFSLTMAYAHRGYQNNNQGAIITSASAYVKSGPASTAEDVLILHEGTEAVVLQSFEGWRKIRLADGKLGWIPEEDIELI
jgi:tetratricopeptide (TPR) repeat protein